VCCVVLCMMILENLIQSWCEVILPAFLFLFKEWHNAGSAG